ncbi:hypothetical protein ACFQ0K_05085 [Nocardioides caeni]|uniref:Tetratricopeptide repeat protein n=1 Tax=Nocardioides caeni TaxID=574700 RepID=A0A4V4HJW0_9ACTN|nr:hypothetical protein [Nocardioides caeni]THV12076.1 hypothetical protein E9934_12000 [Nocardioides caeni]
MTSTNPRSGLRTILVLAGILPTLIVLAFAVKVGLMLRADAAGRDAFDRGDHDGAAADFHGNRSLNWLEPWIAAFGEGASWHADGDPGRAIGSYEKALEDVPDAEECTVRINLALAHESVGDTFLEDQDTEAAVESWQAGLDALREADCPTDAGRGKEQSEDAAAVEKRLEEKLQQQQQDPPPQPQEPEPELQEPPPDPGEDPRQERLERNNQQGRSQRREDQELYDDGNYGFPESW